MHRSWQAPCQSEGVCVGHRAPPQALAEAAACMAGKLQASRGKCAAQPVKVRVGHLQGLKSRQCHLHKPQNGHREGRHVCS